MLRLATTTQLVMPGTTTPPSAQLFFCLILLFMFNRNLLPSRRQHAVLQ